MHIACEWTSKVAADIQTSKYQLAGRAFDGNDGRPAEAAWLWMVADGCWTWRVTMALSLMLASINPDGPSLGS